MNDVFYEILILIKSKNINVFCFQIITVISHSSVIIILPVERIKG